jgi:hypothetical protein|tara:strand:+ start:406 stop:681 length:276 start_codon:yes stop_codon:yes gene_type:complete
MTKRIIYKTDEGGVAIIIPAPNCEHTIEQIAAKDVPSGKPYKIVEETDIPSDRAFRAAWEVDESILTDGVGDVHDMFVTDPQHPDYVETEQ